VGGYECFLQDVERLVFVADQAHHDAVDLYFVSTDNLREGLPVARQAQLDKLAIRPLGSRSGHRASSVSALVTAASNFAV
jgi:hypothetical protein